MKLLIVLSSLFVMSSAQRPSFAGTRPIGVPDVATRFRDDSPSSTVQVDLSNRVGTNADSPTVKIPTDARGDVALVNRVNTWPRENRPFWVLNAEHIEKQRYPNGGAPNQGNNIAQIPVGNRNEQGHVQFTQNRGYFDKDQPSAQNSFTVFSNDKLKTYVYDPLSDSWKAISS